MDLGSKNMHERVGKSKTFATPNKNRRSTTPNNGRDGGVALKALISQQNYLQKRR